VIEALRTIAEISFFWLFVTQFSSLLTALSFPLMRVTTRRCHPRERALSLLVYGLLPPFIAAWVVALSMHPALTGLFQPPHCHQNDCSPHTPLITRESIVGAAMASVAFLLLMVFITLVYNRVQRAQRKLMTLESLSLEQSSAPEQLPFRIIDSTSLLAWCSGLWKPTVFVSKGLLNRLSKEQLQVVLSHEFCHARRGDNLRKTILHIATALWPNKLRRHIKADLNAACEEVCDLEAADQTQSKSLVTAVIKLLQNADSNSKQIQLSSFAATETRQRVTALETETPHRSGVFCWSFLLILLVMETLLFTSTSHGVLEWLTH